MNEYPLLLRSTIRLAFLFLTVAALILTQQLLAPLFLSIMLAYLLFPYADWLETHKVPRILTNLIVVVGFLVFLAGVIFGISALSASFTEDLPKIKEQFEANLQSILSSITAFTGISSDGIDGFIRDLEKQGNIFHNFSRPQQTPC